MEGSFNDAFFSKLRCFLFHFLYNEKKKVKFFILIFWSHGKFFEILLVFVSFLQIFYGICFFHILSLNFCLHQINFYIYLLLAFLTFFYHFHINPSLYLVSLSNFLIKSCVTLFLYVIQKVIKRQIY